MTNKQHLAENIVQHFFLRFPMRSSKLSVDFFAARLPRCQNKRVFTGAFTYDMIQETAELNPCWDGRVNKSRVGQQTLVRFTNIDNYVRCVRCRCHPG